MPLHLTEIIRPIAKSFLAIVMMALSSCTVTRQSMSGIYFPETEADAGAEVSSELGRLAAELSKKLHFDLDTSKDNLGLYAFVADWLGTPYRFGSMGK